MTNERLNQLQLRASRASALAGELERLEEAETVNDSSGLDYLMRCEIYRLGREALMAKKLAELESLLNKPKHDLVAGAVSMIIPAYHEALDCCEGACTE